MKGLTDQIQDMADVENNWFLHICLVEKFEITQNVEKLENSPHLSGGKIEITPHVENFQNFPASVRHRNLKFLQMTNFFLHGYIRGIRDKYQVWLGP